jgi:hypothetical protein
LGIFEYAIVLLRGRLNRLNEIDVAFVRHDKSLNRT